MLRPAALFVLAFARLSLAAPAAAPAQDEAAVSLKLHWEPGQTYVQESDTETTNFLTAIGRTGDQKLRVQQTTRITAQKNAQGQTEARVMIEHLLGEMTYEGASHLFDSNNPASSHPLLVRTLGGAAGRGFTMVYDAEDKFVEAKDLGSLVTGGSTPEMHSIANARQLAALYRRSLEMGLPQIPVHPGDKWISDEIVPFPQAGTVQVKLNAKFDGVVEREGRRQARIAFDGGMKSKKAKDSTGRELSQERPVSLGDDSKVSGEVFFDLERRTISLAIFSASIKLKVEGKILPVTQQVTTKLVSMQPTPAQ